MDDEFDFEDYEPSDEDLDDLEAELLDFEDDDNYDIGYLDDGWKEELW